MSSHTGRTSCKCSTEQERMEVEMAVLGCRFLVVLMVSVDVKQHWTMSSELRICVKVEVAVLGFRSLIVFMFSVDVKQN